MNRGPYDGKPYYCNRCGLGWSEFMACEEECELETAAKAAARREKHYAVPSTEQAAAISPHEREGA